MSSLTISKDFFLSQKCVLTHHYLLFVVVFFLLNRCPHSPDPFSLIVFCFSLQRMSSLTISKDFFSSQKCVLPHNYLLFVVVFFFLNRCPHSPDLFSLIVFCFSLQRMSSLTISKDFFSSQKCVLTHHYLLFVVVFFFLNRCP